MRALSERLGRRRATGAVVAAIGAGLGIPAALIASVGLESALTAWNDQLGLLPWGLSRILGITVYLDIPSSSASTVAVASGLVAIIGVVLAWPARQSPGVRGRARAGGTRVV